MVKTISDSVFLSLYTTVGTLGVLSVVVWALWLEVAAIQASYIFNTLIYQSHQEIRALKVIKRDESCFGSEVG